MQEDEIQRRYGLPRYRRYRAVPPAVEPSDPDYYGPPTVDDFLPSPPKPPSPLARFPDTKALKPVLLGWLLFWAASLHDWGRVGPTDLTASGHEVFRRHESWRLLTALFTHADLGHLIANTPLFLIFGWYLGAYFGWAAFPFGALLVGVLSNLATVSLYPPDEALLGASGMIYGMVALWLVLYVRFETANTVPMRIFRALGVSLLLLFPTTFEKEVSYLAHATGFGIGLVVGIGLLPLVRKPQVDGVEWAPEAPPPQPPL